MWIVVRIHHVPRYLYVAVEQCRKVDILVVGCTTENHDGMFGERLATSLIARGVAGLVIDAGCRTTGAWVRGILATPFGIKAVASSLELIVEYAAQQKLIPKRLSVEELLEILSSVPQWLDSLAPIILHLI
jgi:regulator of RNase E activity RraA